MTVEVTIIDGRVDNLVVLKQAENSKDARMALETIARAIVRAGSDQVDVVTGATVTSKAVLLAVRTALDEASGISR